jgi:hypothetical protein
MIALAHLAREARLHLRAPAVLSRHTSVDLR